MNIHTPAEAIACLRSVGLPVTQQRIEITRVLFAQPVHLTAEQVLERVRVRAQDTSGAFFEMDCDELLAVCVQHEIDHLNGKVFVQYLSNLKLNRLKSKIKKQQRESTSS